MKLISVKLLIRNFWVPFLIHSVYLSKNFGNLISDNRPSKILLFWCQEIFNRNFDFKNECKNSFEYKNKKKYEADPEEGIPTKSILKPFGVESHIRQCTSKHMFSENQIKKMLLVQSENQKSLSLYF